MNRINNKRMNEYKIADKKKMRRLNEIRQFLWTEGYEIAILIESNNKRKSNRDNEIDSIHHYCDDRQIGANLTTK